MRRMTDQGKNAVTIKYECHGIDFFTRVESNDIRLIELLKTQQGLETLRRLLDGTITRITTSERIEVEHLQKEIAQQPRICSAA
jgi:hypothetical protein